MKVIQLPHASKNPYLEILGRQLLNHGVHTVSGVPARFLPLFRSVFKHGKPDLIHLHWHHSYLLASSYTRTRIKASVFLFETKVLRWLGVPVVWTLHNLTSHEHRFDRIERIMCRRLGRFVRRIIVHSNAALADSIKYLKLKQADKICTIPHFHYIDYYANSISSIDARKKLDIGRDRVVFLAFGKIRPYKGLIELVERFAALNHPRSLLLIVGEPASDDYADELKIASEKCDKIRCRFSFVGNSDVQVYMNAADVVVCPFSKMLTSGSLLLALSFKKPVIAPSLGFVREILPKDGNFLYDPDQPGELEKQVEEAIRVKPSLESRGVLNFNQVKALKPDSIAAETAMVYQSL